ncbi:MAG: M20/M25/M40 family metallo-hydrolase [Atopobiaceae bacterium]|jgi:carboxypeptidase PM20D1|nr:M20/M25/M40 family metallo-hydrolase [Atopobiaceae bacterium]MCH4179960.1 M20/M25/M40 family metallo-hydrolase [Atopobiaceae bacterium]MCH4213711.1 M20/M25/M40 family metallo-hydrolase [Atopobiaceae bacterium]MCH4275932.1 M20/M25/M40 family metallo-hydrolase [Atopobiaceae bacterium]MCI1225689.1 M20/M25/M40 family metallo-hydrolase [Atopobiaceae bacterium]
MAEVWRYFAHEDDYPDLDTDACCERLAGVLRFPTIAQVDLAATDWEPFEAQLSYLEERFPRTFAAGTLEVFDHSVMLTLPGTDASLRPAMLMAHQDVVPVMPGTEGDWTHGPFEGFLDGTYVWGRGSVDMKDQLMGELEACEYLLAHGSSLARPLMFCFGCDEEVQQTGGRRLGHILEERGVRLEYLLDEGDYVIPTADAMGAPGVPVLFVSLAEKGYCDLRLTARGAGGHSSNPFGGTTLGRLSQAVAAVVAEPWAVGLVECDREMLAALAPQVTEEPLASLVRGGRASVDAHADEIAQVLASQRETFPYVATTVAPTMCVGGSTASNVMPQDMFAVIDLRAIEGDTQEGMLRRCQELAAPFDVDVELYFVGNDPSATSRADGYGFAHLAASAGRYFEDPATGRPITVAPNLAVAASDARMYECVCDSCLRMSVFMVDGDESARGVHGTDERITRRAYVQGIRVLIDLLEHTCVEP